MHWMNHWASLLRTKAGSVEPPSLVRQMDQPHLVDLPAAVAFRKHPASWIVFWLLCNKYTKIIFAFLRIDIYRTIYQVIEARTT
jgi:hypothetical protein